MALTSTKFINEDDERVECYGKRSGVKGEDRRGTVVITVHFLN